MFPEFSFSVLNGPRGLRDPRVWFYKMPFSTVSDHDKSLGRENLKIEAL